MSIIYHPFKKTVKGSKGKTVVRWYYWWADPVSGIHRQKRIPGNVNKMEAFAYVMQLSKEEEIRSKKTIAEITRFMFVPGSEHMIRLENLGKKLAPETIYQYRRIIDTIEQQFGPLTLEELTIPMVTNFLLSDSHSGGWKNKFIDTLGYVYSEAPWQGEKPITKPKFPRFARNSKKADILSTSELSAFFTRRYWNNERDFLIMLVIASFGLRIGEAMGIKTKQFVFDNNALIIDGFCKQNGTRTNYNKKGSDEDTKMRVAVGPSLTMNLVAEYIRIHDLQPDDYVFQREGGLPMRREYLETVFNRQLTKCGIEKDGRKLVPHSLRFTYVTRLRRELPIEMVQKIVGHSSAEMTEYYTRAAIPEMIAGLSSAIPAAETLFQ